MSNCPFNLQGKVNQPARNQTLSLCLIEVHCFQCPISVRGLSIRPVAQIRVLGVILEIPFSFTFIANPWVFFVFILNISWMCAIFPSLLSPHHRGEANLISLSYTAAVVLYLFAWIIPNLSFSPHSGVRGIFWNTVILSALYLKWFKSFPSFIE